MHSFAKNTIYLLATRWFTKAARLLYSIVLARYLGPEQFGILSYGIAWYLTFFSFRNLGIGVILSRSIGRNRDQGAECVVQTLALRSIITVLMVLLCAGIGWYAEKIPDTKRLLLIFSVALAGRGIVSWTQNVFTAYEVNYYGFRQNAIFRTLEVLLGSLFVLKGGGVFAVAFVHALVWWLQALVGIVLIRRDLTAFKIHKMWSGLRPLLLQGLLLGLSGTLISWFRQGPLIGLRFLGNHTEMLGQFAVVMQSFWVMSHLSSVLNVAALPALSRAAVRRNEKDLLFSRLMLRGALILGACIGFIGLSLGPFLVSITFGTAYEEAGRLVGFALWLMIPWTIGYTLYTVSLSKGRDRLAIICTGLGITSLGFVMLLLIPPLGIAGALLSTAIGMTVWATSLLVQTAKSQELKLVETLLKPGGVVFLAAVVFFLLHGIHAGLALPGALLALFGGLFISGGILPEDKAIFSRIHQKITARL